MTHIAAIVLAVCAVLITGDAWLTPGDQLVQATIGVACIALSIVASRACPVCREARRRDE